jgi:pimeloyl-ACP methyl ester carboxylesterase
MKAPQTLYAKGRDGFVAYQVIGEGPLDLVFIPDWVTNLEIMWEEPSLARFLRRLSSFGRLVCFDKRGCGLSDPVLFNEGLSAESWIDDTRTVLHAIGSERHAVFGHAEAGRMAMLYAATFPEHTSAVVLLDTFARRLRDEGYPWGIPEETLPRFFEMFDAGWGNGGHLNAIAPSVARDPRLQQWYGRYQRHSMGPTQATGAYRNQFRLDVRAILPTIRVPTLVLHRKDNAYIRADNGRYLAEHIPGAKFMEVPGIDHLFHAGETDVILDAIEEFLTGRHHTAEEDRVLATVLFADIVGSTERAAALGDRAWRDLLEGYYGVARGRALPRPRDRYRRRRLLRCLRRAGAGDTRRLCDSRRGGRHRAHSARRPAHRRVREGRRENRRTRRAHRRPCRRPRGTRRGAGVGDRARPRRRFGDPLCGAWDAHAQGRAG